MEPTRRARGFLPSQVERWRSLTQPRTRNRILSGTLIGVVISAVVLGLRSAGLLHNFEITLYDQYIRSQPRATTPPSPVLIVQITEQDIRQQAHWPLSDRTMARTLSTLVDAGARVVGLDIYRDLPVPPGGRELVHLLHDEHRIIAVHKFHDANSQGIPGPAVLRGTDRTGFNDLVVDRDATVRRGLLFQNGADGEVDYSFALRVALHYLEQEGVFPTPDPEQESWLRIGHNTIAPFDGDDGGYRGEDDSGYQFLIDGREGAESFRYVELTPLLRGEVDPNHIRDRIVLIGVAAESVGDFFHVPWLESKLLITGVELHGHLVSQLVRHARGQSSPVKVLPEWLELIVIFIFVGLGHAAATGIRRMPVLVFSVLAGLGAIWLTGWGFYALGVWVPMAGPGLAWVSTVGMMTARVSSVEKAQRALLMSLFSRHVSPQVADDIWTHREEFLRGSRPRSQRLIATVLFVDMKGYSEQAERMDPQRLMDWVNDFMESMAETVVEYGGIVDDYFGDGIKANFGVPFARESEQEIAQDARQAVRCALAMEKALRRLNAHYRDRGLPTVAMRIGINTGPVVAGSLGSAHRLKYTVVGDVVVTAERLESLEQVEHDFASQPCRILISQATRSHLDRSFQVEPLGEFSVKGRGERVAVHRVLAPPASAQKLAHSA